MINAYTCRTYTEKYSAIIKEFPWIDIETVVVKKLPDAQIVAFKDRVLDARFRNIFAN